MSLEKTFQDDNNKKRIQNFFDEASIFVPNKYIVLMYGEYVEKAIEYMQEGIAGKVKKDKNGNIIQDGNGNIIYDTNPISDSKLKGIAQTNFDRWVTNHYDNVGKFINLKWTCSSVTIPSVNSETEDGDYLIDSKKGIRYPLIKTHVKIQTLTMKILEDRKMMMYQFFNALTNQFHDPKVLKPTSSFHKLGILVIPLNAQEGLGQGNNPTFIINDATQSIINSFKNDNITSVASQVFEFNSAVLVNVEAITLSNKNKTALEYGVSFKVPNTFQGAFNYGLSGLANNTSDSRILNQKISNELSDSAKTVTDSGDYNTDTLEDSGLKS